jgi:hypothetical protein
VGIGGPLLGDSLSAGGDLAALTERAAAIAQEAGAERIS